MAGAPGGLVVTADEQTAGRGRRGNEWFAPPGSCLLYSGLLQPFADAGRRCYPWRFRSRSVRPPRRSPRFAAS